MGGNGIPVRWNRISGASAGSTPPRMLPSPSMCTFFTSLTVTKYTVNVAFVVSKISKNRRNILKQNLKMKYGENHISSEDLLKFTCRLKATTKLSSRNGFSFSCNINNMEMWEDLEVWECLVRKELSSRWPGQRELHNALILQVTEINQQSREHQTFVSYCLLERFSSTSPSLSNSRFWANSC